MWKSKEAELNECFLIFLVYDFRNELCMTASNTKPFLVRPSFLTPNLNLLKAAIMCVELFWLSSGPLYPLLLNRRRRVVLEF